jgi:hypothetical protein
MVETSLGTIMKVYFEGEISSKKQHRIRKGANSED